jgi:hypothetical protein
VVGRRKIVCRTVGRARGVRRRPKAAQLDGRRSAIARSIRAPLRTLLGVNLRQLAPRQRYCANFLLETFARPCAQPDQAAVAALRRLDAGQGVRRLRRLAVDLFGDLIEDGAGSIFARLLRLWPL